MKRSFLLALVLTAFLAACAGGARQAADDAVYDFGLPPPSPAAGKAWPQFGLEVTAPTWGESPYVDYRLLYEEPLKRRSYANSRWAGAPNRLLARYLRQQLGMSASDGVVGHCRLSLDLLEFSQHFSSATASSGVLQASAQLLDPAQKLIAVQAFHVDVPAPSANAAGGVKALAAAGTALGQRVSEWLLSIERQGGVKPCLAAAN